MWGFGRDLVRYWQLFESQGGGGFARFVAPVCGDVGLWLELDEISKMAASLPAMIYGDSKMAAIALAKMSGYNTPRGINSVKWG